MSTDQEQGQNQDRPPATAQEENQDQDRVRIQTPKDDDRGGVTDLGGEDALGTEAGAAGPEPGAIPASGNAEEPPPEDGTGAEVSGVERRLTPRQARRLRIALSSLGMIVMAVVLGLRIASRSSVLVVGVYGLALILCGVVIELSRNGRTRLGSWLLGVGLLAAVGADWLLLP